MIQHGTARVTGCRSEELITERNPFRRHHLQTCLQHVTVFITARMSSYKDVIVFPFYRVGDILSFIYLRPRRPVLWFPILEYSKLPRILSFKKEENYGMKVHMYFTLKGIFTHKVKKVHPRKLSWDYFYIFTPSRFINKLKISHSQLIFNHVSVSLRSSF